METNNHPFSIVPSKDDWLIYTNPSIATLYGVDYKVDLLTGEKGPFNSCELLESLNLENEFEGRLLHLSYEAGLLFNKGEDLLEKTDWLAIDLHFQKIEPYVPAEQRQFNFSLNERPSFENYEKVFNTGYQHLEAGDCYQFNLTFPFKFNYQGTFSEFCDTFFRQKEKLGEYAHATFIPLMNWGIVSNSPECLFNQEGNFLETRPIKGTIKDYPGAWEQLQQSEKDKAELYMITDLLRNDLNRIEATAEVVELRSPLKVPGIIHQFSRIRLKTESKIPLQKVFHSLFPGGSITGAPKIKVMKILKKLENRSRGIYCGSTVFFGENKTKVSINIRTAEVDTQKNEFYYGSGGGVTLLSEAKQEYTEMLTKVDSFTLLLQR